MRVIFMGTPDFAVSTLMQIIGNGHKVVAVYTQPPRPADRGMAERKSPVHTIAESFRIPVLTPTSLKDTMEQSKFKALKADVAVVVAYGQILPKPILTAPKFGCLNLHASKLPRWRGAAPIQRAIMAGDSETAATVMKMDEGLDTGQIALEEIIPIDKIMTAGDLHDKLAVIGADLMVDAINQLEDGPLQLSDQKSSGVSYAHKISKYETRIKWSRAAKDVHNHIRGISPWPGAWCEFQINGNKERLKVLRSRQMEGGEGIPGEIIDNQLTIACGSGAVRLEQVQRAGKKPMSAEEFLRGTSIGKSAVLL
ncbi:MAG: methionyl-tRNA formyltransferase [Rhizobiales bacterium]|nr:methionyl-tRNA formyltransferase [Hyphomicrobiales bacterium]